jgi:type I restriction enzyme S subunit
MREDWENIIYKDAVYKISTSKQKLKQKEYLTDGAFPIVDQGQDLIGGYTNDETRILNCDLPVIVFGDHTKNIKLIDFQFAPGADGTKILEPSKFIVPEYISYLTKILVFKIKDKGYARHYQHIEKEFLPLAPLPIQRAIVSKTEELFSDLDNGIANLKKAQEQLKIYRQAVLKKAFEGDLTKEWREKQTNLPTAEELLKQIKEERQNHYEKQIEDWKKAVKEWEKNGKEGKKPSKPKTLQIFTISNEIKKELPVLQFECFWFALGNLFKYSPQNGLYKPSSDYGTGTDIIRIDNFYEGKIIKETGFKKVRLSDKDIEKYLIQNEQILINRVNSINYLGKSGLVNSIKKNTVFESNIMKLSVLKNMLLPNYLTHYLTSLLGIREIRRFAKHAVNQASINQTDVSLTPIPICSIPEQHQIVQEIETRLSVCDKVEESITESMGKAKALRQSILKKAFEGKLLSKEDIAACKQEKDYDPASVLLEKIKAEKLEKEQEAKKTKKKSRK